MGFLYGWKGKKPVNSVSTWCQQQLLQVFDELIWGYSTLRGFSLLIGWYAHHLRQALAQCSCGGEMESNIISILKYIDPSAIYIAVLMSKSTCKSKKHLSISVPIFDFISEIVYLFCYRSACLTICLPFHEQLFLSFCLSNDIYIYIYIFVHLSIYICLFSFCLSIYISFYFWNIYHSS